MATVTVPVERLSPAYLGKIDVYDQEDKVMQEAAEVFGASRGLTEAKARLRHGSSDTDRREAVRATRHLAEEVIDLMVAAYGLAHKHGVDEHELRRAAERVNRRNRERGRC